MTAKPTITTAQFRRTWGHEPEVVDDGSWAFQASTTPTAFEADRYGDVRFFPGTYDEAAKTAAAHFANGRIPVPYIAVLG